MQCQIWYSPGGSVGGGLINGTMASASTSVWEKAALPSSCLDAGQLSSSAYVSGAFQAAAPVLELRGDECE